MAKLPLSFIAFAVALVVVGSRWALLERAASPVPFQDQWYAEGEDLYLAAGRGGVPVGNFFRPHNDHRIVPTRLLAYSLFKWNDQWDVRVQMLANALLAAALCLPLLALCRPWVSDVGFLIVAAMMAWFYSLPVLYENALWGFQSQFYFLVLFSLLQIQLTLGRRPYSFAWWCGFIAGMAAGVSMGSGLLASVAVAVIALWRIVREPEVRRALAPTLVGSAILAAVGLAFLPPRIGAAGFDFQLFLHTIGHALDFPERGVSFAGCLVWFPFAVFFVRKVLSRETSAAERVLLASGAWVLLQVAAIGYARPEPGPILANRYGEILAVGLVANLAACGWLAYFAVTPEAALRRYVLLGGFAAWFAFVGWQAVVDARIFRHDLEPMMVSLREEHAERIRAFVRRGEVAAIGDAAYPHIPVVDAPSLVRDLRFPEMADALPFEVRTPIPLNFPESAGASSLNNAIPVSLPNEPAALHRGTFFKDRGAAGVVDVTSAPAHKHPRRRLMFKVAGDFRRGETELRIRDASGAVAAVITDLQSEKLRPVVVAVPGETFHVEVFDRSPTRWIAFLDPVEIGPFSAAALKIIPFGPRIAAVGWVALAGLGGWAFLRRKRAVRAA